VVVGVSGGPDSLCLLHVLRQLATDYDLKLHVAHLDHCIRGSESQADAAFVRQLAAEWKLPATVEAEDVPALARARKLAIEEAARQARYTFLARVAHRIEATTIAVGHNADDQTETVIMHWLRGSGLAGLRGMLPETPLTEYRLLEEEDLSQRSSLRLIRPLLEVPRKAIEAYCREHGLQPRFDLSNLDTTYYRNRLRHELIPYLEGYNPNIREVVRRMARVIADDYAWLRADLLRTWPQVVIYEDNEAIVFDRARWRMLPLSLQRSTLRRAVQLLRRGLRNINWVHIEDAMTVAREHDAGAQATLPQGLLLTVGYDTLTVAPIGYQPPNPWPQVVSPMTIAVPGRTTLSDGRWRLETQVLALAELPAGWQDNPDRWTAYVDAGAAGSPLVIRGREPGERFQPLGLAGRWKPVRELMINAKVPQGARDSWPLVVSPTGVVWVTGFHIDERVKITPQTRQVLVLRLCSR